VYKIAICDDEKVFYEAHEKICREILERLHIAYEINLYQSGEDFLRAVSKYKKRYDVILLDVIMSGMNGIDLAKEIRKVDKEAAIVFITSHVDFALKGYDVHALHYLLKPVDPSALEHLLAAVYAKRYQSQTITIKMGSQNFIVNVDDIIYMETSDRRVKVVQKDKTVFYSGKLTDLMLTLPRDRFVRCHHSFALNINNVREIARYKAVAVNGENIPVSRTYLNETKNMLLKSMRGTIPDNYGWAIVHDERDGSFIRTESGVLTEEFLGQYIVINTTRQYLDVYINFVELN
jgi:DNA-binding LytR/AlgR family response regulator